MINVDFHCHLLMYRSQKFKVDNFKSIIKAAEDNSVDILMITDHFLAKNFWDIYEYMIKNLKYENGFFHYRSVRIIPGCEIELKKVRGHILVFGMLEDFIKFRETNKDLRRFKFSKLIKETKKHNLHTIGAHPLRKNRNLKKLSVNELKKLDYLEYNGKDFKKKNEVKKLAKTLNIKCLGGSDSHNSMNIGTVKSVFKNNITDLNSLIELIEKKEYKICYSKALLNRNYISKKIKRQVKKNES